MNTQVINEGLASLLKRIKAVNAAFPGYIFLRAHVVNILVHDGSPFESLGMSKQGVTRRGYFCSVYINGKLMLRGTEDFNEVRDFLLGVLSFKESQIKPKTSEFSVQEIPLPDSGLRKYVLSSNGRKFEVIGPRIKQRTLFGRIHFDGTIDFPGYTFSSVTEITGTPSSGLPVQAATA